MDINERTVLEQAYRSAYIKEIASSVSGISETDLQNATIDIILSDDGNNGINVDVKITNIPSSSPSLLESVQQAIVSINSSGDLASTLKDEINTISTQNGVTLTINLNDIPSVSEVFIILARIDISGIEVDIPNLDTLLSKSLDDMSESEKYVLKEAYLEIYIKEAAKAGVVLTRDNVIVYLVSGSVKIIIKVVNIEISNTVFAKQVEDFFEETSSTGSPITPQMISDECLDILNDIINDPNSSAPPSIKDAIGDSSSSLYTELQTNFQDSDFINAVETSTVENVTIEISSDGELKSFVIIDISGVGKGIKKLPNKDASMFIDERKRNAIKQGKLNNSVGGIEKESIVFQVKRAALRRARNTNYRVNSKYTKF